MSNMQLAENLRYLRKKHGLKQEDLKKFLNISRQAYSNYERCERTPDLDALTRLSQMYRVRIDDLLLRDLRTLPDPEDGSAQDAPGGLRESVSPYTCAKNEETGKSLYLTEEELDFILNFRSLPKETKQIITGFLKASRQEQE